MTYKITDIGIDAINNITVEVKAGNIIKVFNFEPMKTKLEILDAIDLAMYFLLNPKKTDEQIEKEEQAETLKTVLDTEKDKDITPTEPQENK